MPALVLFGRRWRLAGDEVMVSSFVMVYRSVWCILLAWFMWYAHNAMEDCSKGTELEVYTYGSLVCFALTITIHLRMVQITMREPLVRTGSQKILSRYVYGLIVLAVIELALAIGGASLLLGFDACDDQLERKKAKVLMEAVVVCQMVDLVLVFTCGSCCCVRGKYDENGVPVSLDGYNSPQFWENKCRQFCACARYTTCNLFGGDTDSPEAFASVAYQLSEFFSGALDVVPSDIMAGLVLLRAVQKDAEARLEWDGASLEAGTDVDQVRIDMPGTGLGSAAGTMAETAAAATAAATGSGLDLLDLERASASQQQRQYAITTQPGLNDGPRVRMYGSTQHGLALRSTASLNAPLDVRVASLRCAVSEAAHWVRYALGIYGWMLYVYARPFTGFCTLCPGSCMCPGNRHTGVWGDNCCLAQSAALLKASGLKRSDLVFANMRNSVFEPPYCIAVDAEKRAVVVAIRGTLSFEDCLTDAMADPVALDEAGLRWGFKAEAEGQYAHAGMLKAAQYVRTDLLNHAVLEALLKGGPSSAGDGSNLPDCTGYRLVVTGHSLGAGTAVLLALMLRADFPSVRCWAFSPPGGMLTEQLADMVSVVDERGGAFVTSPVLHKDLIPRLSLHSLYKMRDQTLMLLARTKVSKAAIFRSLVSRSQRTAGSRGQPPSNSGAGAGAGASAASPSGPGGAPGVGSGSEPNDVDGVGGAADGSHSAPLPSTTSGGSSGAGGPFAAAGRMFATSGRAPASGRGFGELQQWMMEEEEVDEASNSEPLRGRLAEEARRRMSVVESRIPMHTCGRMLHLVKSHTQRRCCGGHKVYIPQWKTWRSFDEILVSATMMLDHFPDRVDAVLQSLATQYRKEDEEGTGCEL